RHRGPAPGGLRGGGDRPAGRPLPADGGAGVTRLPPAHDHGPLQRGSVMTSSQNLAYAELEDLVAAFEAAQAQAGPADLAAFLPPRGRADYLTILCELIRVDLEYGWGRGRPQPLSAYQERFPDLFAD